MRRLGFTVVLCVVMAAIGGGAAFALLRRPIVHLPDPPALVTQIREVARLETLDVALYKKVSFEPDPKPTDGVMDTAIEYAKFKLLPTHGKAIVFADGHLSFDLSGMDARMLRVEGERVLVRLPPLQAMVELKPDETEVINSNLDSQQTAELFAKAKLELEAELQRDQRLHQKARASAERAIRGLLLGVGFREVVFVDTLPEPAHPG